MASAPALLDEMRTASRPRRTGCGVGAALAALDDATRNTYVAAMADPSIQGAVIARFLTERHGLDVRPGTVQRHRNKACSCGAR